MSYPKIELHVHLEGTITPGRLLEIARRNDYPLPTDSVQGIRTLYDYRDFDHFIEVWILVTNALRRAEDFHQIVVDYARRAAEHGAVYLEAIFSPIERTWRGVDWDELFSGYGDGAQDAREQTGVEVRLTPDITRDASLDDAMTAARYANKYRQRGVVGLGLGGEEAAYPPEPFEPAFRLARDGGLGSVPHAGEVVGPASVWGALDALGADRIRHGIRAHEDPALLRELVARGTVLDVCPISNVRTGAVPSLAEHPLPSLVAAGVTCSISTDDPAMFDTDLTKDCDAAAGMGLSPQRMFEAGVTGALCDDDTRARLRAIGQSYHWDGDGGGGAPS
jgi:aminodeoxyfutalosine deaminase